MPHNDTITAIEGLLVGHCTDELAHTGCTAVICPQGFTPGLAVPGFATGSRETELLRPESLVESVHGIVLAGGSAFGLAAADGVVRYLREQGHGFRMPHGCVPLVSGAVLYDLDYNQRAGILPDAGMGYDAALSACCHAVRQGAVGAGTGARCGRLHSLHSLNGATDATARGGLGSALVEWQGLQVGALAVVNSLGDVYDPDTLEFLAGGRDAEGQPFTREAVLQSLARLDSSDGHTSNTVLTVIATNVPLNKNQTSRLARMGSTGLARVIRPVHLTFDGDVVFALAAKKALPPGLRWSESLLGALAAKAVAKAVVRAVG